MAAMDVGIRLSKITKSYRIPSLLPWKKSRSVKALDGVSFACPRGQITGLLGPNGAGKTTILKILAGLVTQDSGTIELSGEEFRDRNPYNGIGLATSNDRSFYWRLTGRQNLDFFATLYGFSAKQRKERVTEILAEVGLEEDGDKPFRLYSSGMKQKLIMARAMISNPSILLLDEPTVHIDPLARNAIYSIIRKNFLEKRNTTILLCTHDLLEAQLLSEQLILLDSGKILAMGELSVIQGQLNKGLLLDLNLSTQPASGWQKQCSLLDCKEQGGKLVVTLSSKDDIPGIVKAIVNHGGGILDCRIREDSLLDIFHRFGTTVGVNV